MTTTPTGVPIIECSLCGWKHSAIMGHCQQCGHASRFVANGLCIACRQKQADRLFGIQR